MPVALVLSAALCSSLIFTTPPPPTMAAPMQQTAPLALSQIVQPAAATSTIFPEMETSMLLAAGFEGEQKVYSQVRICQTHTKQRFLTPHLAAHYLPSILTPTPAPTAQEEKDAAKLKGVIIFLVSALPSVWAQDQLVWKKERAGQKVMGDGKSKRAGTKRGRGGKR